MSLPSATSSALSPDVGLDLSGDTSVPSPKGKVKGGFKLPKVEGTIDLLSPSEHIGLDADISPNSTLKKRKPVAIGGRQLLCLVSLLSSYILVFRVELCVVGGC